MKKDKRTNKKKNKKSSWKENIYNSPYLILILITSLTAMCCSDEIGIRAIAKEAKLFAYEAHAKMPGKREQAVMAGRDSQDIKEMIKPDLADEETEKKTGSEETSEEEIGNAGSCKIENDDKLNNSDQTEASDVFGNDKNAGKTPIGITNYEFYNPVQIDSPYYKDAGKIALTTAYPYTKENISYFNDAAFLGDSRTLGISDYAGLEEADFYCDSGMMIFKLLEDGVTYQRTGNKVNLPEVMQEKQYGKIYIMLGMNELGYGNTELYFEKYSEVLQRIREWQPEAIIYIMANLHVSREKNNLESEFNNININDKNAASASLANGTDVFYLDVNPLFTDEEGFLNAELTFDGVHLYAKHYDVWRDFLLEHAVEPSEGSGQETDQDRSEIEDMTE